MGTSAARSCALAVLLLAGVAFGATDRRVRQLDVAVETPVYELADDLPPPSGRQHYRLSWSGIPVGRVQLEMRPESQVSGIDVEILGATHPVIDWLWRYRFEGRGRVQTAPFAPAGFVVDECENRRHKRTEIRFAEGDAEGSARVTGLRTSRGREREYVFASSNTFDLPSSVYLVLNLDYEPGARFALDTFTGKSRYLVDVLVVGRETVQVGEYARDAWRLRLHTTELTDDDPDARHSGTDVWISEERPRELLRATARTYVGSIRLELDPNHDEPLRGGRCA